MNAFLTTKSQMKLRVENRFRFEVWTNVNVIPIYNETAKIEEENIKRESMHERWAAGILKFPIEASGGVRGLKFRRLFESFFLGFENYKSIETFREVQFLVP